MLLKVNIIDAVYSLTYLQAANFNDDARYTFFRCILLVLQLTKKKIKTIKFVCANDNCRKDKENCVN